MLELIGIFHISTGQPCGPMVVNNEIGVESLQKYFYKNHFEPRRLELWNLSMSEKDMNELMINFTNNHHICIVKSEFKTKLTYLDKY